jgi:hypothetical protein
VALASDSFQNFCIRQSKLQVDFLEKTRVCTTLKERLQVKELEVAHMLNDCAAADEKVEDLLQEKTRDALRFEQDYMQQLRKEIRGVETKHAKERSQFKAELNGMKQLSSKEVESLKNLNKKLYVEVEAASEKASKLSSTQQRQLQSYQGL